MSYKEKPQIKLYKYENNAFSLVAIIDDYSECSWENNRFQAGVFSISINYNIPNALLFAEKLWVQFGNNPYSFGEINKITDRIGADGKGSQIRTITGYDARYIFKRRIIKSLNSENTWSMTAKGEICMRSLIADQCGAGAETKRRLPVVNTIPAVNDAIGSIYSVSESFTNLYEVLRTIATQTEIGWRIRFDGELTLEFYEGEDRRETVRFDTNYDSLQDGEFTDSLESYANSILISGKGTGADRDLYEGETGTPQGLDRFEAYSNQSEMTTEEEYEAQAQSMLSQYGQTLTVSGNGLAKCPYIYGEQYDVGDIITVSFSGKSAVVQILSVTEHWRHGAYDITFSFGKPQNTLSEQLQIMLRKIQQASDKTTATSSVKWYTIPTDTAMSVSDVVYDTIGFTGDCGSGATFTLYLDDESTGAKEYNVYFKNLSGGKITLTTGKTGAENAVMNSGTYVAMVYVDPQGNITVQSATATSVIESGNNQPATSDGVNGAISAEEYARNMAIANAINALDVTQAGGDGKYIESISETDGKISATEKSLGNMVPVNEVTSGNMHSVTSNAVAGLFSQNTYLIPIITERKITNNIQYEQLTQLWIGQGLTDLYNRLPQISGKTKKVYLYMSLYTEGDNGISIMVRKRNGDEVVLVDNEVVWGGIDYNSFAHYTLKSITPDILEPYTQIFIKSSASIKWSSVLDVAVGFIFAYVCYE